MCPRYVLFMYNFRYSWYKNGEHMSYTTYIYIQPGTGNLVFEVPTILDEGYYQCMAENQNGKVVSQKTKLTKISKCHNVKIYYYALFELALLICCIFVTTGALCISFGLAVCSFTRSIVQNQNQNQNNFISEI